METLPQRLKPQHSYPLEEISGQNQQERLMQIDVWLDVLFVQMEADYREMHRLPPNLQRSNPQPPTNSI